MPERGRATGSDGGGLPSSYLRGQSPADWVSGMAIDGLPRIYKLSDVAKRWDCSENHVRKLVENGRYQPAVKAIYNRCYGLEAEASLYAATPAAETGRINWRTRRQT